MIKEYVSLRTNTKDFAILNSQNSSEEEVRLHEKLCENGKKILELVCVCVCGFVVVSIVFNLQ